jgi:hypothetical protein
MYFPPLVSYKNMHAVLKSSITQLYFMLHRNQERPVRELIREIFRHLSTSNEYTFYESLLRRIVIHTRNMTRGKGERWVFYVCVVEWFSYNPTHAIEMIDSLVFKENACPGSPYGSWRDIRGIAEYVYQSEGYIHPLIQYCAFLLNHQLTLDFSNYLSRPETCIISNAVKWAPRERANIKWFFSAMIEQWTDVALYTSKTISSMKYRKMCSTLNAHLSAQHSHEPRGIRYCPGKIVSIALASEDTISDLLWQPLIRHTVGTSSNVLPLIDARLEGQNMHTAIGLSLALAEISCLGKRILGMGHNPMWISIPNDYGFTQSAKLVSSSLAESPLCRIETSVGMLIQSFVNSGMTSADIEQLCLVVFSSMDFGEVALHDKIQAIFLVNSMQMPHIVYWGINAHVFPCAFDTPRTTLISGETSAGFQIMCDMHLPERRNMTPYLAIRRNLQ